MKKTLAILSGCLVVVALLQTSPAQAGSGCCPKGAKAEKAACGASADQAAAKTCVVDGKTVACTKNADGSCTLHAGAVAPGAKTCVVDGKTVSCAVSADGSCTLPAGTVAPGAKTCVVDGKTVSCTVNADGTCTIQGAAGHCAKPAAGCSSPCGTDKAKHAEKHDAKAQSKASGL